jgi:plasmid replication DNA-binding protein KfrA
MSEDTKAYGEGRVRVNVTYGDVERAAIAILRSEHRRPTVETVREALGRGSPDTISHALKRFWHDLGARMEGDPAALSRMPTEIADVAEGMWQRALKLAAEAAKSDDNAARERLKHIEAENEIRAHSLALREREIDTLARERERALADSRAHEQLLIKTLGRDQASLRASEARVAELEAQVAQYREEIATLLAAAVTRNRGRAQGQGKPFEPKRRRSSSRRPRATTGRKTPGKTPSAKSSSRRAR